MSDEQSALTSVYCRKSGACRPALQTTVCKWATDNAI